MPKLNDSQLVILSAAAKRENHSVLPLPKSFKGGKEAAEKAIKGLLKTKLLQECPAKDGLPVWREAKDEIRFALVITDAGMTAIGIDDETKADPTPTPRKKQAKKEKPSTGSRPTKLDAVVDLLKRSEGASIDELMKATGWQAHSVRGAISGSLKKKLGLKVDREKTEDRGSVYRIA